MTATGAILGNSWAVIAGAFAIILVLRIATDLARRHERD
jgi:hypothetical protein